MRIADCGTGYIGLSNAVYLSQGAEVFAMDIVKEKFDDIYNRVSPIIDKFIPVLFENPTETEAISLFSNKCLVSQLEFFNKSNSYPLLKEQAVERVCLGRVIGDDYRNLSFGYVGYFLLKVTNLLIANLENVIQYLIQLNVKSNRTGKNLLAEAIITKHHLIVGFYHSVMKNGSDIFGH